MKIFNNISLRPYNTFQIDAVAQYLITATTIPEIQEAAAHSEKNKINLLPIGEGSNILFTTDFEGLVLKIANKGISILSEDTDKAIVKVNAGEIWDDFVNWCVNNNLYGLENLSNIPGNTGTAPIQNIGAYGTEVKQTIVEAEYLDIHNYQLYNIPNAACEFGYRTSIFKKELKNSAIITSVTFQLSKQRKINISYNALQQHFNNHADGITASDIRNAVIAIRSSKLPDYKQLGNAGSFFKNPVINNALFDTLKEKHSDMPFFEEQQAFKIPAAWLIEQSGWKGKKYKNCGVHEKQPLVIVNYGNCKGTDIAELAVMVKKSVFEKFGIFLETEVNFI